MADRQTAERLVVVLGDQLNADAAVFDGFDKRQDVIWMAEVDSELTHVWTHKARIAVLGGHASFP